MFKKLFGKKRDYGAEARELVKRWAVEQSKNGAKGFTIQKRAWDIAHKLIRENGLIAPPEVQAKITAYDELASMWDKTLLQLRWDGEEFEKQNDIESAIEKYYQLIHHEPNTPKPYERLRILHRKQDDYKKAIRVCELAIENENLGDVHKQKFAEWAEKMKTQIKGSN